jgi:hypothetical protein
MGKRIDLTNEVSGELKVLAFEDTIPRGRGTLARWRCLCSCGNEVVVRGDFIRSKHSTSCGRCDQFRESGLNGNRLEVDREEEKEAMARLDLVGQTRGEWEILSSAGVNKNRSTMFLCRCSCGEVKVIRGSDLVSGASSSCGHDADRTNINKINETKHLMTGTMVGKFLVKEKTGETMREGTPIYYVECTVCHTITPMSARRLRTAKRLGRDLKCIGCKEKNAAEKFRQRAEVSTLPGMTELSLEQAKEANRAMRNAVWRTAPGNAKNHCEDIVNDGWIILLQEPNVETLSLDQIGGLAYRIAQNLAKRTFEKPKMRFKEPKQDDEDGTFPDVFDNLWVKEPGAVQDLTLEIMALECLTESEKQFMLEYVKPFSGFHPYDQKIAFETLCDRVKKAHQEIVLSIEESNLTKGEYVG